MRLLLFALLIAYQTGKMSGRQPAELFFSATRVGDSKNTVKLVVKNISKRPLYFCIGVGAWRNGVYTNYLLNINSFGAPPTLAFREILPGKTIVSHISKNALLDAYEGQGRHSDKIQFQLVYIHSDTRGASTTTIPSAPL